MDGKAARGSRHGDTPAAHLLAMMTGDGRTATQLRVPDKTNEITCFTALPAPIDLTEVTVTADALHTQRGHVPFLVEEKKAHYLLVVKGNRPGLHRRLRSLPWRDVTARRYAERGPRDPSSSSARSRPRPRPELAPLLPDRGLRLSPDTVRPHPAGAGRADAGASPRRHCRPAIRARARNAGRWCSATYWMRPGRRAGCRTAWRP
ncbi:hypothetical protein AB0D08_38385 [Kitasatospora sp. NPDC048540]|uniref:hypothetical protein n=1 Tax=Kitasatospora sp. NPDC048540 TaxID=3155634 RepID=UPI0033C2996F